MSHPTVSAGYARALLDFAVAQGASAEALQRRSGLDNDALADPDNRVPLQVYKDLMSAAKVMCDDPALPLHLGAARNFTEISVVDHGRGADGAEPIWPPRGRTRPA
jgi:hypothetical protein